MLNFTAGELITLLVLLPLVGGVIGYVIAADRMRRHSGGKTPAELKTEFDDYQRGVGNHFQHSAELLQQMTEQYREIYTHMAHGAAELCGDGHNSPEVEALQRLSLALDDAAAVPAAVPADEAEDTKARLSDEGGAVQTEAEPEDSAEQQADENIDTDALADTQHTDQPQGDTPSVAAPDDAAGPAPSPKPAEPA